MKDPEYDLQGAAAMVAEVDMVEFQSDLVSLDGGFVKGSAVAVVAQRRDAGILVKRSVMP